MSEFESMASDHSPAPQVGRLRQAREATGLHIAVMATMLKVPVRKLEALEAGRFHELPDITFARALAMSACRHLKIDPEPILAEFPGVRPAALTQMAADDKPAFRPSGHSFMGGLSVPAVVRKPAVWMAVVILGLAAAVYFWPVTPQAGVETNEPSTLVVPDTTVAVVPSAEPDPAPVPVAAADALPPSSDPDAAAPAVDVPVAAALADPTPVAVPVPVEVTPSADEVLPSGNDLLQIVGTGESWMEVTDAQGRVLLRRMLQEGEVHRFNTQPPYRVLLGKAQAAQVRVRGKDFDLEPHTRNSVARFEVQ
jgi:cytoskeleton protein RodZ